MPKKILVTEPWIGEFGWELFCWHGFLRAMARHHKEVTVTCRTGHGLLYRDFATITELPIAQDTTDMWMNTDYQQMGRLLGDFPNNQTWLRSDTFTQRWWLKEPWSARQDLRLFNTGFGPHYDIVIIVRNTNKCGTGFRNWPVEHATQFVNRMRTKGLSVVCVGESSSSLWIPGTIDARDVSLEKLANIMNNASVIVGPQSGPIHFATLCGLPQVCWQTCREHADRVQTGWNPFNIDTVVIPAPSDKYWKKRIMWVPEIEFVVGITLHYLKEKGKWN